MAYAKIKTEMGSCTPHSQSARWMPCGEAKSAAKRKRRQLDRQLAQSGFLEVQATP